MKNNPAFPLSSCELKAFRTKIAQKGQELYRDFAWRNTTDPYKIWISEVMLQQTQTARVEKRFCAWIKKFPTVDVLALASVTDVLNEWQGMGYNRRALALLHAAQMLSEQGGTMPSSQQDLQALPGIGPATAAGICAFAYNQHVVYLETNVRSVFLHEFFRDAEQVDDKLLIPYIEQTCPPSGALGSREQMCPRMWYYALLDYGAHLKKTQTNPARKSKAYVKQSKFEGSHRQKRAELVRLLLAYQVSGDVCTTELLCRELNRIENSAKREDVSYEYVQKTLEELACQGFCVAQGDMWRVA